MHFEKSENYNTPECLSKIMGPNPVKLTEELLFHFPIPAGSTVCDLGSGQGLTSVFLAKEYNLTVYATDLWSDPAQNRQFFDSMGLTSKQIVPIKADAEALPFNKEFFDAILCTDSYNYFGRSENYLDAKLLPFLKKGGILLIAVPGMKKDLHANLPAELLLSWTPEQLDYIHDIPYWTHLLKKSRGANILSIREMECHLDVWEDWIKQENEYAVNDRKSIKAGGGKYLNFISITIQKQH